MEIQGLINETSDLIIGWVLIVLGLITKDILTSLVFGIMFYLNPQFQEGDIVYINGDKAIIYKIGLGTTVFKIIETQRWRYIKNTFIRKHTLEKKENN